MHRTSFSPLFLRPFWFRKTWFDPLKLHLFSTLMLSFWCYGNKHELLRIQELGNLPKVKIHFPMVFFLSKGTPISGLLSPLRRWSAEEQSVHHPTWPPPALLVPANQRHSLSAVNWYCMGGIWRLRKSFKCSPWFASTLISHSLFSSQFGSILRWVWVKITQRDSNFDPILVLTIQEKRVSYPDITSILCIKDCTTPHLVALPLGCLEAGQLNTNGAAGCQRGDSIWKVWGTNTV